MWKNKGAGQTGCPVFRLWRGSFRLPRFFVFLQAAHRPFGAGSAVGGSGLRPAMGAKAQRKRKDAPGNCRVRHFVVKYRKTEPAGEADDPSAAGNATGGMTMGEAILERSQLDPKDLWAIEDLYSSDEAWEADLKKRRWPYRFGSMSAWFFCCAWECMPDRYASWQRFCPSSCV